jgi:hypothetical protein
MQNRLYQCVEVLRLCLEIEAPKDTTNLARNGIRPAQIDGEFVVLIGGEIAPYAEITNESWDGYNPPLKGHKNPNEGWIDRGIKRAKPIIKQIMSGAISEAELEEYKRTKLQSNLAKQYKELEEEKQRQLDKIGRRRKA